MPVDAYAPCPCGSGKKFKWCCQAFYDRVEKAFEQNRNGQHAAALRTIEQLTQEFPSNAEVWGRYAELLWENQRQEEAEKAVDQALEANPNYAFAYFMRGMFRHEEGEVPGALLLYRKAAELCHPDAHDQLAEIHGSIGQCEMMLNRPLAARAGWEICLRQQPDNPTARRYLDEMFGPASRMPAAAIKEYSFRRPAEPSPERQSAWEHALAGARTGRLSDALQAFETLTSREGAEPAAWYNLGLVRAWLGNNSEAIDAFDRFVEAEPDLESAAEAWAVTEVLRLGEGMTQTSDYVDYRVNYRIVNPEAVGQGLSQDRRIVDVKQQEGMIGATLLDRELPPADEHLALYQLPRVAATLVIIGGQALRLTSLDPDMLAKARQIVEPMLGSAVAEPQTDERPPALARLLEDKLSIRLPANLTPDHAKRLINECLQQAFEDRWVNRPLKSLNRIPPIDAAGHVVLRKKLHGVVRFLDETARASLGGLYDFNRLRQKLGLPVAEGAAVDMGTSASDITALSVAQLTALDAGTLSEEDLNRAFRTAVRLDARELAGRFALAAVERPPLPSNPDRFPLFSHLIQLAVDDEDQDFDEALSWVDSGLKQDCEHNEGRRRNDYELRRAQVHLRAGRPDDAFAAFDALAQRVPSDLNVLGAATEGMLAARQSQRAAGFAERGLAKAKAKGDADRAGYFEELLNAARKV